MLVRRKRNKQNSKSEKLTGLLVLPVGLLVSWWTGLFLPAGLRAGLLPIWAACPLEPPGSAAPPPPPWAVGQLGCLPLAQSSERSSPARALRSPPPRAHAAACRRCACPTVCFAVRTAVAAVVSAPRAPLPDDRKLLEQPNTEENGKGERTRDFKSKYSFESQ